MNKTAFLNLHSGQSNDLDLLGDSVEKLDRLQGDFEWSQRGYFYRGALNVANFITFNWKELRPFMFGVPTRIEIQSEITAEVNSLTTKIGNTSVTDHILTTLKTCVQNAYRVAGIKQNGLLKPALTWGDFINSLLTMVPGLSQAPAVHSKQPSNLVNVSSPVPMLQFTRIVGDTTPRLPTPEYRVRAGFKATL